MSYGVAESELLTEETVLRRVQGAMSYKFSGQGWYFNQECTAIRETDVLAANHESLCVIVRARPCGQGWQGSTYRTQTFIRIEGV